MPSPSVLPRYQVGEHCWWGKMHGVIERLELRVRWQNPEVPEYIVRLQDGLTQPALVRETELRPDTEATPPSKGEPTWQEE